MKIETLRKLAGREVIDYSFIIDALKDYATPRDKISSWLASGELIRIKKGLYVFGREIALAPYSPEVIANLIYGPSAISLRYALAYYGLIPERVSTITSITNKRNKSFTSPIGIFTYQYLSPAKYPIGIELSQVSKTEAILIASPEKALCDHIYLTDKEIIFKNDQDVEHYLIHDLRIDESALRTLHVKNCIEISVIYKDKRLERLAQFIKKWKKT